MDNKTNRFQKVAITDNNLIIVKLRYMSPEIEMTVLDARITLSDKIANLGGTFGIWADLTGCSLLGIINLFIILIKFECESGYFIILTSL